MAWARPGPVRWAWGAVAAAVLAAAATWSVALGLVPGVPLLDGLAPPAAYRWIRPPSELRSGNHPPTGAAAGVGLGATGSTATVITTPDDQVLISMPAGVFPPSPGQTGLLVSIQPLDPAILPPPPPGVAIQGNAYRVAVTYVPSGVTATTTQPVDVTLRYPVDATEVILLADTPHGRPGGPQWQFLPSTLLSASLAVDATTAQLGVMAAAGTGPGPSGPRRTPAGVYVAAGLALLVAGIPTLLRRRHATP